MDKSRAFTGDGLIGPIRVNEMCCEKNGWYVVNRCPKQFGKLNVCRKWCISPVLYDLYFLSYLIINLIMILIKCVEKRLYFWKAD